LAVTALFGYCPSAFTQTLSFTRIADTSTPIPGGSGTFFGWDDVHTAAVSGSTVVFEGGGSDYQTGLYSRSVAGGPLSLLANQNSPIPNGTGTFVTFSSFTSSGSTLAFFGSGNSQLGLYSGSLGGPLTQVADYNTPIPGGSGNFSHFYESSISLSGSAIAFHGNGGIGGPIVYPQAGIYSGTAGGGALTVVANRDSFIPGGTGNFVRFADVSISGSTVVFLGFGTNDVERGIYAGSTASGTLTRVADRNTPIPNGSGNFSFTLFPCISGSTVAFVGVGGSGGGTTFSQEGVYTTSAAGGSITRLADLHTPIPQGTGNFASLLNSGVPSVSISGSTVAFRGLGSNGQDGIYYSSLNGGALTKVVAAGDMLDGRVISSLSLGPHGLDGSVIAFEAFFNNGSSGVYATVLPVPEPSLILGLAATAFGAFQLLRRSARAVPSNN
jgi:hypothetical protein